MREIWPAPPDVREAVAAVLQEVGCPGVVAAALAEQVTSECEDGTEYVCLYGTCVAIDDPDDQHPFQSLAANVAADNAEAHDRSSRGEVGYEPLWPLPDRRPRS